MKSGGRRVQRYGLGVVFFAWGFVTVGCVERLLQVRSDPPGATVYINGKNAGQTPLDFEFTHYGAVDVILRHEEHLSHRELFPLRPPWYEYFPLDFISELVVPWTIHDNHGVNVTLERGNRELDEDDVAVLRARGKAAQATLSSTSPPDR